MFGSITLASHRDLRIALRSALALYVERALWILGILGLSAFLGAQLEQRAGAEEALREFYLEQSRTGPDDSFDAAVTRSINAADKSNWSQSRIAAFATSVDGANDSALAVLRVPRLALEAPVFAGALEKELDRGPGWIRGTAPVGTDSNVGIAGHRDGYFRALKDIQAGDVVEVLDPGGRFRYRVSDIWIVEPDAVHVLDPTDEPSLTLVTCYPFYFVGHAPKRFVVRAVSEEL